MAKQPDIYDLFRDNEHKLAASPSPKTWQRLERRLDRRGRRRQLPLRGLWSIAAAIVLLVLAIFVFTYTIQRPEAYELAATEALEIQGETPAVLRQVAITRSLGLELPSITEGSSGRRLIARSNPLVVNYSGRNRLVR